MYRSTFPVKIRHHAKEQDQVGHLVRWHVEEQAGQTTQATRPVRRNWVTPAAQQSSTSVEGQVGGGPLIKKQHGKAVHLRPASSSRDNVLDATNDAIERSSKRNNAVHNGEQANMEERATVPIKTCYAGRDVNMRHLQWKKKQESHSFQQQVLMPTTRELETKMEESPTQNPAPAEQISDPLLGDLQPILDMLLAFTPQITAKEEDIPATLDGSYWEDDEFDGDRVSHYLGDVIDDITYTPQSDPPRVRKQLSGPREKVASLALQQKPEFWTPANFKQYMRRLVALGHSQNGSEVSVTTREIVSLLEDGQFMPYIHQNTLHVALGHLSSRRCYEDMMQIFHLFHARSFAFSALNFSQFMYAATWHEDSMHFRPILEHMLECDFKPTGHTWYAFYQLISRKCPSKRRFVLRRMRKKGLTMNDAPTIKDALVKSLGWIEYSDVIPKSPSREPNLGNDNSEPSTS